MHKQRVAVLIFAVLGVSLIFLPWLPVRDSLGHPTPAGPWRWIALASFAIALVMTLLGDKKSRLAKVHYRVVRSMGLLAAVSGIYTVIDFMSKNRLFYNPLAIGNRLDYLHLHHSFFRLNLKLLSVLRVMNLVGIGISIAIIAGMAIFVLATVLKQGRVDFAEAHVCGECKTCLVWQHLSWFAMQAIFVVSILVMFDLLAAQFFLFEVGNAAAKMADWIYLFSIIALAMAALFHIVSPFFDKLRSPHLERSDAKKRFILVESIFALFLSFVSFALMLPDSGARAEEILGSRSLLLPLQIFMGLFILAFYCRGIIIWTRRPARFLFHSAMRKGLVACKGGKSKQ